MPSPLVCPHCHVALADALSARRCGTCGRSYPLDDGIIDFAEGAYYDVFTPGEELAPWHAAALETEKEGAIRRIRDFYLPLIRRSVPDARRVLDCGCGNGLSVDLLNAAGFEAWGNDVSQLRKWQWRERAARERLVVASGMQLPFADDSFDVVLASGVIEHIGVEETLPPNYTARALPSRDRDRRTFLDELLRVGKTLFLDCPNGAFPIDFWHGNAPGSARLHRRGERFLPTFREIRDLVPDARVQPISPLHRLQFRQAAQHWYGRLFAQPAELLFRAMRIVPRLAATPLNPFLVVRIERRTPDAP